MFLQTASSYALGLLKSLHTNATLQDWTPFLGEQQLVENTIELFPFSTIFSCQRPSYQTYEGQSCKMSNILLNPTFIFIGGALIFRFWPFYTYTDINPDPQIEDQLPSIWGQLVVVVNYLESDLEFETKCISTLFQIVSELLSDHCFSCSILLLGSAVPADGQKVAVLPNCPCPYRYNTCSLFLFKGHKLSEKKTKVVQSWQKWANLAENAKYFAILSGLKIRSCFM